MTTRAERKAKCNAVGQGRPVTKENKELAGELVTELPEHPADLIDTKATQIWDDVCSILISRKVLKPAHYRDLITYCNCMSYIKQIDDQLYTQQDTLAVASLEQKPAILTICDKLSRMRKTYIDSTLTIGSRFGLDALSERRFTVPEKKEKSVTNGFLEL